MMKNAFQRHENVSDTSIVHLQEKRAVWTPVVQESKLVKNVFYPFITQFRLWTTLKNEPFENIVGKGENANQHFLLFTQCFIPIP